MRRNYRSSKAPKKQFINSYHVNEVPLPYYNPLQDPYLQGFFNNEKVSKHISEVGFVYRMRKDYPYLERRTTNYNKFFRNNSYHIPPTNRIHNREQLYQKAKSYLANSMNDLQSTRSQLAKKMSDSELFSKSNTPYPLIGDILAKRPSTTRGSQSSQTRQKGRIYANKRISSSKMNHQYPLIF